MPKYKYPKPYSNPPPHEVKVIQRDIAKYLKYRGIYYYKPSSQHAKGNPDFICCYRGLFVGFEAKRPFGYGTITKLQEQKIKEIREADGFAFVVYCVDDVEQFLKMVDKHIMEM